MPKDHKKTYRLERKRIGHGGFAEVFKVTRKSDGAIFALKRLQKGANARSKARMHREIKYLISAKNNHTIEVFDHDDEDYTWYVMPLALETLEEIERPMSDKQIRELIKAVLSSLEHAHDRGYPHRDLKPENILRIDAGGVHRWVVADWGLTRRPRGETTSQHTEDGRLLGSDCWAPPEAWTDAHNMGAPGDFYMLGKIVAWASTIDAPVPNRPLRVEGGWAHATMIMQSDRPEDRPQTAADVWSLIFESFFISQGGESNAIEQNDENQADDLLERIKANYNSRYAESKANLFSLGKRTFEIDSVGKRVDHNRWIRHIFLWSEELGLNGERPESLDDDKRLPACFMAGLLSATLKMSAEGHDAIFRELLHAPNSILVSVFCEEDPNGVLDVFNSMPEERRLEIEDKALSIWEGSTDYKVQNSIAHLISSVYESFAPESFARLACCAAHVCEVELYRTHYKRSRIKLMFELKSSRAEIKKHIHVGLMRELSGKAKNARSFDKERARSFLVNRGWQKFLEPQLFEELFNTAYAEFSHSTNALLGDNSRDGR